MKKDTLPLKEAKKKFIKSSFYCGILAILVCWFMKLFGFDYFGLDLDNKFFNDLDMFLDTYYLKHLFSLLTLHIQLYLLCCCVNKCDGKPIIMYLLKILPITIIVRLLTTYVGGNISNVLEIIYVIMVCSKLKLKKVPKAIIIIIFNLIYQIISLQTRSLNLKAHSYSYLVTLILPIDYFILLYLHKEMEVNIMGDTTWFFFGITAWLYWLAGFIVGIFKLHPLRTAREWYAKGKEKENARKTKRELKKSQKQ
jgi:hypothetical protein